MATQTMNLQTIDDIKKAVAKTKIASRSLSTLTADTKNKILHQAADALVAATDELVAANKKDMATAGEMGLSQSMLDRLELDPARIKKMADAVRYIAELPDPVGGVKVGRRLPNGVNLEQIRVPLGVVGVIYESRPNVSSDISSLCLKSGNAAVLRGGKEALHSNQAIVKVFKSAIKAAGLNEDCILYIDNPDRKLLPDFLKLDKHIDIIVPRGGEALIRFVAENSTIPVVKHDKGVCNVFIDESAVQSKAEDIIINSKVQRPSVCNAAENLILHRDYPFIREVLSALTEKNVKLHADADTKSALPDVNFEPLTEEGYQTEYLDYAISVKIVADLDEALAFITENTSEHSEAIVSENYSNCEKFAASLDTAAVFINCSTRFHDGGEFGLGAEVGISTGKLHVRGPMGLEDLTTTKYIARGTGQIR